MPTTPRRDRLPVAPGGRLAVLVVEGEVRHEHGARPRLVELQRDLADCRQVDTAEGGQRDADGVEDLLRRNTSGRALRLEESVGPLVHDHGLLDAAGVLQY